MQFVPIRRIWNSVSFKVAFLFCATIFVGMSLAFMICYFQIEYSLEKADKEIISAKFNEAATVLEKDGVKGLQRFLVADEQSRIVNSPFMFRVLSSDGQVVYAKSPITTKRFDLEGVFKRQSNPNSVSEWQSIGAINDEDKFDILTRSTSGNLFLQVGKSSEDREDILDNISDIFLTTGTILILVCGGLGMFYITRILRPLRRVVRTIKAVQKGELDKRVVLSKTKDELFDVGDAFNQMVSRIESLVRIQRESLDNVAHDIRTPLTRLKAVAEDAMISNNPTSQLVALEECAEGASEISGLVDQLMSISEAEAGTMSLRSELCEVKTLLQEVVDVYEFVAIEKSIAISIEVETQPLVWAMDRKRIKQVVANLLDNALKFSNQNSDIIIRASIEHDLLKISVVDQGIGIAKEEMAFIWERLYRGDKSRSSKGSGLGLSIVRAVVVAHGGKVEARQNAVHGSTFLVEIPQLRHS